MKHLAIGGSSFARTLACPGWIKASENLPKTPPGPSARVGSMQHMVQEVCQRDGVVPSDCLGMTYVEGLEELTFTENDLQTADIIYRRTNQLMDELDIDEVEFEPFVQLIPDVAGGSIDVLGLSADRKTILIADYKTGRIEVSPVENAQLMFYAICAGVDPATKDLFKNVKHVVLAIIQPTTKAVVTTWECPRDDLRIFKSKTLDAIKKAQGKNPRRIPGPECKWCPAAPYCQPRKAAVIAAKALTPDHKGDLQASADILEEVEAWVSSVKAELFTQLSRGLVIDGWKIVDRKGARVWTDEIVAMAAFMKANIPPAVFMKNTLLTAPQTIAALKKAKIEFDLDDHVEFKSSGVTLAPESDGRDAVTADGVPDNLKKLVGKK